MIIERDNRTGDFTELKTLVRVDWDDAEDGISRRREDRLRHDPGTSRRPTVGCSDKPEGIAINRSKVTSTWSRTTTASTTGPARAGLSNLGKVDDILDD